jgi:acetaldehyde dehydrogenase (acetylating)
MLVGVVGSGNIGTDLMLKLRRSDSLTLAGVAGIDPESEGLALARSHGFIGTSEGLADLLDAAPGIEAVFDATSAGAHAGHAEILAARGIRSIDLTPAALGPAVVPDVNANQHLDAPDINLITCGAQATVPIVAALAEVGEVEYAEMISTLASKSAGPGTRANIDEFTLATARSLEVVGGAAEGKALIVLNPADPPILMRNTVYARIHADPRELLASIERRVEQVARYVPGYRLAAPPMLDNPEEVTVMLEVEGAGDYLPPYAGNLDIMTSAAVRLAEDLAEMA